MTVWWREWRVGVGLAGLNWRGARKWLALEVRNLRSIASSARTVPAPESHRSSGSSLRAVSPLLVVFFKLVEETGTDQTSILSIPTLLCSPQLFGFLTTLFTVSQILTSTRMLFDSRIIEFDYFNTALLIINTLNFKYFNWKTQFNKTIR